MSDEISFEDVRTFCVRREVDLVLATPPATFALMLRAEHDAHAHFFSILLADVEYVDIAGGITVQDLFFDRDIRQLVSLAKKWASLPRFYSGGGLVLRSVDLGWEETEGGLSIIVANRIVFSRGPDWMRAGI